MRIRPDRNLMPELYDHLVRHKQINKFGTLLKKYPAYDNFVNQLDPVLMDEDFKNWKPGYHWGHEDLYAPNYDMRSLNDWDINVDPDDWEDFLKTDLFTNDIFAQYDFDENGLIRPKR